MDKWEARCLSYMEGYEEINSMFVALSVRVMEHVCHGIWIFFMTPLYASRDISMIPRMVMVGYHNMMGLRSDLFLVFFALYHWQSRMLLFG